MDHKVPKPSDPQLVQRSQSSAREAWRMFEIIAEFVTATERLHSVHPAVTVFGSARVKPGERWYGLAEDIAHRLSQAGFSVISGGGPGVMEAGDAVAESVMASLCPHCSSHASELSMPRLRLLAAGRALRIDHFLENGPSGFVWTRVITRRWRGVTRIIERNLVLQHLG